MPYPFLGEGSRSKKGRPEKSGHPYSNLSNLEDLASFGSCDSLAMCRARLSGGKFEASRQGLRVGQRARSRWKGGKKGRVPAPSMSALTSSPRTFCEAFTLGQRVGLWDVLGSLPRSHVSLFEPAEFTVAAHLEAKLMWTFWL